MHQIKISDKSNKRLLEIMAKRTSELEDFLGMSLKSINSKPLLTYDSIVELLLNKYDGQCGKPK